MKEVRIPLCVAWTVICITSDTTHFICSEYKKTNHALSGVSEPDKTRLGIPTPANLRKRSCMSNMSVEGEMDELTEGSQLIVDVVLDDRDDRLILAADLGRHQHYIPSAKEY